MTVETREGLRDITFTRRGFIKSSSGMAFAIGAPGLLAACTGGEESAPLNAEFNPSVWTTLSADGEITVQVPAAEMGQGSMTSLPAIFAEELDADWDDITPVQVTRIEPEYGNPFFGGFIYTGGSRAVQDYYPILRLAGAQVRRILMQTAADAWGVPLSELTTQPSKVVHPLSRREISYGQLAAIASAPEVMPEVAESELKSPESFRYIGRDVPRWDAPLKSTGQAIYAMDVQVDNMVYAAVLHSPVEGETPLSVDDGDTLNVPGVLRTLTLENAVAVIGETVEATRLGKELLEVDWSEESPLRATSNETTLAEYSRAANDLSQSGNVYEEAGGEIEAALGRAAKGVTREYFADYVYHAQMEPLNATADVYTDGSGAEIWIGTQSQQLTLMVTARVLGVSTDDIKLNQMLLGGGFGRRAEAQPTYLLEALELSKQLKRPVKVIWSREDDLQNGWYRPTTAQLMRAGFDETGELNAWSHRMSGPSVLAFYNEPRWNRAEGRDVISMLGTGIDNYHVPNKCAEHVMVGRNARLSPWRGVASGYTKFAVESFVDELAVEQGIDPMEFRLNHMHVSERGRRALEAVATASDWGGEAVEGRAKGCALVEYHETVGTGVFEVSVDEATGKITVHRVWLAGDVGLAVQPYNVIAQLEGACIYGIGQSLTERVTIKGGETQETNFHDYIVPRMLDVPEIHAEIIASDNPPSGVGELTLPLTGPGIANAFYALTGKRIRHMPLTRDRVLQALRA